MPKTAHTRTADRLIRARATVPKLEQTQGRKRGAPRKFTAYTVSQLLETYRDPRAVLMEIASTETATLAKTLNCTMQDALAERRLCAQAVLPYVAQKLPAQIDLRSSRTINLNIVDDRQYKELVEIAATEEQSDNAFSMQLLTGQTIDETPVTPPTPAPSREGE